MAMKEETMPCEQNSTKQEKTAGPCPCAQACPKKAVLLAVIAVPLAFWAIRKLRR
jgi:hypothetical protein